MLRIPPGALFFGHRPDHEPAAVYLLLDTIELRLARCVLTLVPSGGDA